MPLASVKYQHRVLGLLSLLSIITYLDRICIAVAGPRMQDSLHISPQGWGWVTSVFFLSYSAFEIPTGMMGDSRRPAPGANANCAVVVGIYFADWRGF
jgi:ACS family glucarate transporter-like MFS transporter